MPGKKRPTLHLVPHTHWDREWYQPYQVFRLRLVNLMDKLLDIMAHQPDYAHFMLDGQTIVLEDYLELRPEKRETIRRLVQEGRLAIGPWYVLPDEFLVSPEALIRNLIVGSEVAKQFGHRMDVGYLPDPFGHIAQMPQILLGFGIEVAAVRRGLDDEPVELWWEAPDGSRVLLAYLRDGYGNAARLPTAKVAFAEHIRGLRDSLAPYSVTGHILLLNGTDHHEAQPEIPSLVASFKRRLNLRHSSLTDYLWAVRKAGGDFLVVRGELRSPKRHHLLPGVLSTRMWIKQRNHAVQTLLERWAEPFSAWASLLDDGASRPVALDGASPAGRLRAPEAAISHAWRLLLQNHPHDSICGCSVDQVHEEMRSRFDQAEQIGEQIVDQNLVFLTEQINTRALVTDGRSIPIVVFNSADRPRTDIVTVRACLPADFTPLELLDSDGQPVPVEVAEEPGVPHLSATLSREEFRLAFSQVAAEGRIQGYAIQEIMIRRLDAQVAISLILAEGEPNESALPGTTAQIETLIDDPRLERFVVDAHLATVTTLRFVAHDVPPLGYRTYLLRPSEGPIPELLVDVGVEIENEFFHVFVNPDEGTVTLMDKRTNQLFSGLNCFVDGGDRGDTYNYCPPMSDTLIAVPTNTRLEVHRCIGEVTQTLTFVSIYRLPASLTPDRDARLPLAAQFVGLPVTVTLRLTRGVPRLDIEAALINDAADHRLQVYFPTGVHATEALFDGHFEVVRRSLFLPSPEETQSWIEQPVPQQPQRNFVTVHDDARGLTLANRGLPEVAVLPTEEGAKIVLTLLRCVGWLSRSDLPCRDGAAGPEVGTPAAQCPGEHVFTYSLISHQGDLLPAWRQARAFQTDLRALTTNLHDGPLSPVGSLMSIEEGDHFMLSAVKSGGDQRSLIVRGYSVASQPEQITLVPGYPFRCAMFIRLDEKSLDAPPLYPDSEGRFTFTVTPAQIVTLRFEL